jgi:hypothetical protein
MTLRLCRPRSRHGQKYWFVWGRLEGKLVERSTGCSSERHAQAWLDRYLEDGRPPPKPPRLQLYPPGSRGRHGDWVACGRQDRKTVRLSTGCLDYGDAKAWLNNHVAAWIEEEFGVECPPEPVQLDLFDGAIVAPRSHPRRRERDPIRPRNHSGAAAIEIVPAPPAGGRANKSAAMREPMACPTRWSSWRLV